mmetsp:Transcript_29943/g.77606  ORF Transcript_29943/g.77606 Transcript_29943/m.77606 type:complete len:946 (-) Transcript_29943:492-3329(-)
MLLLQVAMQLAEFDNLYPATLRKHTSETRGLLVDAYGEVMREAGRADGMALHAVLGCQAVQVKIKGVRQKIREIVEEITKVLLHMRGLYDPMKPQMVGRRLSALKACAQKGEQALLPYLEKIDDIYCRLFEAAHAGSYNHVAGFIKEGPQLKGVLSGYMAAVQGYAELHMNLPKAFLFMVPANLQQVLLSHEQLQQLQQQQQVELSTADKMRVTAQLQRYRQRLVSSIAAGLHDTAAAERMLRLATRYYASVARVRSEGFCQGLEHEECVALFDVAASMSHVAVRTLTAHDAMGFGSQGCMERALGRFKAAAGAFALLKQRAAQLLGQPPPCQLLSGGSMDFWEKLMLVQAKECLHNIQSSAGEPTKEIASLASKISRDYEELETAFPPFVTTIQPHLSHEYLGFKSWLYLTRKLQSGAAVLSHRPEQHNLESHGARQHAAQKPGEDKQKAKSDSGKQATNKDLGLKLLEDALKRIQDQMLMPCAYLQGHPDILVSLKAFEESIVAAKAVAAQSAKGIDAQDADSLQIKAHTALEAITSALEEPFKASVTEELLYLASPHQGTASEPESEEEDGAAEQAHASMQDTAALQHTVMKLDPGSLQDLSTALDQASSLGSCVTLDLGGHVFCGDFPEQLKLTHSVTLCNGTLELMGNCHVSICASYGVWLKGVTIRGHGEQPFMVDVCGGSMVHMLDCTVEGGGRPNVDGMGGAVGVRSDSQSKSELSVLEAERCSMVSGSRCGLQVVGRARAVLRHCRSCGCAGNGWMVEREGSSLAAWECEVSGNGESNVFVGWGASAALQGCSMQGSKWGRGLRMYGSGSAATLISCKLTGNKESNANIVVGASATLFACDLDGSEGNGLTVAGKGSFVTASATSISGCQESNVLVYAGGAAVLLGGCTCNNSKKGAGWRVHGSTSSLTVHASSAKGGAQDGCGYSEAEGGRILYL